MARTDTSKFFEVPYSGSVTAAADRWLRSCGGFFMIDRFTLCLVDSIMLAPHVRQLRFARADGQALPFVPGQFLQFHFIGPDGTPIKRSYSIATPSHGREPLQHIEVAVSYVEGGRATAIWRALAPGHSVEASGPYGRFCLHETDRNQRYLLLATGTGVTPYRAMLPLLAEQIVHRGIEVALLYGARNEQELLYGADFEAFAQTHPAFVFHPCFSRLPRQRPRPYDRSGHVQNTLSELQPDAARDIAYLCGNPAMVDTAFAELKDMGLAIAQIRREKYIFSH